MVDRDLRNAAATRRDLFGHPLPDDDIADRSPGRLPIGRPVATIDIGSNSVRLVAYEGLTRAPTPIFNEKVLCGLGRAVTTTGRLNDEAVERALKALARFRVLCRTLDVGRTYVLATAAARYASNGPDFIARAEEILGQPIQLLSGTREAELSALGVVSGFPDADGIVGDLGGGSLELIGVRGAQVGQGISVPLGGLALQDQAGGTVKRAERIVRNTLMRCKPLEALRGRSFYAVGGTWRALAKLHMSQRGYPLRVMHGYRIPPQDAVEFSRIVERVEANSLDAIESISEARRGLLAYGAVVLEEIVRKGKPREVVISALGVREGLLYEELSDEQRGQDPLICAARDLNTLRSRAPRHGEELIGWTDRLMESLGVEETGEEKRLRHAACLLADIGWRAHPDYRGEQSLNIIAHAAFVGIDHPGRAFLALSVFFRHMGLSIDAVSPRIRELVSTRLLDRARILGGAMRVAYLLSAAMPGILPHAPLVARGNRLILDLPSDLTALANERLANRLRQLAKLSGREPYFQMA